VTVIGQRDRRCVTDRTYDSQSHIESIMELYKVLVY